jgi:hypothetical protein
MEWDTATGSVFADIRETHTGVVVLVGDKAYKAKKSIATDFLDFSTHDRRGVDRRAGVRDLAVAGADGSGSGRLVQLRGVGESGWPAHS